MAKGSMTLIDVSAFAIFLLLWIGFSLATGGGFIVRRVSLTRLINEYRGQWIRNSLTRDLKMIDTQILAGLQNGTAFFASTSIFALGGCFALLGATDQVLSIYHDLPVLLQAGRSAFELKVGGLAIIFGYSFFKFGWSYRLFNYCTIMFGSLPMTSDLPERRAEAEVTVERIVAMNVLAGKNFNAGLRAIFLSIGYLGWFVSPYVFILATVFVIAVLSRRQFFSDERRALLIQRPDQSND